MLPPTASIVSAICSAVRVFVPLSSTFAINCVMPLVCGVSASRPPRKTAAIETSGRRGSSRTRTRRPFDSSNFLDFARRRSACALRLFAAERAFRIQRNDREIIARQVLLRDAADVFERHFLDRVEIIAAEIQIPRQEPVRTEIGSLAAHRGQRCRDDGSAKSSSPSPVPRPSRRPV